MLWNLLFLVWALVGVMTVAFAPELGIAAAPGDGASATLQLRTKPALDDARWALHQTQRDLSPGTIEMHGAVHQAGFVVEGQAGAQRGLGQAVASVSTEESSAVESGDIPSADIEEDPDGEYTRVQHAARQRFHDLSRAALHWLKDHQDRAGFWCPATFGESSTRSGAVRSCNLRAIESLASDTGQESARIEATALALLHFVDCGYDHKEGNFKTACRNAILWLRGQMFEDGNVGDWRGDSVRTQAWATLALAEVYGLSADPALRPLVERSLQFLLDARIASSGWGLRYRSGEADVISTALAREAIHIAALAGIELVTEIALRDSRSFLWQMCQGDGEQMTLRYSASAATAPGHCRGLAEAAWLATMLVHQSVSTESPTAMEIARRLTISENLPQWRLGQVDTFYWWFACRALYQMGSAPADAWFEPMRKVLRDHQRGCTATDEAVNATERTLDEFGSWDVADAFGARTGRVGVTAICGLVYSQLHRFERLRED